jgi:hypothetical protein
MAVADTWSTEHVVGPGCTWKDWNKIEHSFTSAFIIHREDAVDVCSTDACWYSWNISSLSLWALKLDSGMECSYTYA